MQKSPLQYGEIFYGRIPLIIAFNVMGRRPIAIFFKFYLFNFWLLRSVRADFHLQNFARNGNIAD